MYKVNKKEGIGQLYFCKMVLSYLLHADILVECKHKQVYKNNKNY